MGNLTFREMICEWANLLERGGLPQIEGRLHDDTRKRAQMDNLTFHEMICEWANLLEHGGLPQTEGLLHDDAGHCCLGVMCEVLNVKRFENTQIDTSGEYSYGTAYGTAQAMQTLPDVIADKYPQLEVFAGDILLKIPPHLRSRSSVGERERATELNDSFNFSFKEIAECVRYTWPGAFA